MEVTLLVATVFTMMTVDVFEADLVVFDFELREVFVMGTLVVEELI